MSDLNKPEPLLDIALAVWGRRKWLLLASFALLFSVSLSFVVGLPSVFKSDATIVIERGNASGEFLGSSFSEELEQRFRIASQQLLSRSELMAIIGKHNLYPALRERSSREVVVEQMRRDTTVEKKEMLQKWGKDAVIVVDVGYQSLSPEVAAAVTKTLAETLISIDRANRVGEASGARAFLDTQLNETRNRVLAQERRMEEFRERYIDQLPEQQSINFAKLRRLTDELRANRERQRQYMDQKGGAAESPSLGASGSPEDYLSRLKAEYRRMRLTYTDKYPQVTRLKERIDRLEGDIARGVARPEGMQEDAFRDDALGEMGSLKHEENKLRQEIAALESKLGPTPSLEYELKQLDRDYDSVREHYFKLVSQRNQAMVTEQLEQQDRQEFRLLEPAAVPTLPSGPKRLRLLILATLFSTGVAVFLVLAVEHFDDTFHELTELRDFSNLQILSAIPRVVTEAEEEAQARWARIIGGSCLGCCLVLAIIGYLGGLAGTHIAFLF